MPLGNMPIGTIIHNVELKIGKGGQLARSAGTYAQLVGRDAGRLQALAATHGNPRWTTSLAAPVSSGCGVRTERAVIPGRSFASSR